MRCPVAGAYANRINCGASAPCADTAEDIIYSYDTAILCSSKAKGRPSSISDASGSTEFMRYDERGRARVVRKSITADGTTRRAQFSYDYDRNDRLTAVTYPDGEVVRTDYDASGQPIALRSSGRFYVSDAHYDVFGRARSILHGSGVEDSRTYGDGTFRHRLSSVRSALGATTLLDMAFPLYTARGQLRAIFDLRNPTGALANSTVLSYDHLGRLTESDTPETARDESLRYDPLGRMTRLANRYFEYNGPGPHQVTAVRLGSPGGPATAVAHDANGNRAGKGDHDYHFDHADRLRQIVASGMQVDVRYDHSGRQTTRSERPLGAAIASATTRYYNDLLETRGGVQRKYYFFGGMRVAQQINSNVGWETAALFDDTVRFAAVPLDAPALVVELTGQAPAWLGGGLACVAVLLVLLPWRAGSRGGWRPGPAPALGTALLVVVGTLPWALVLRPAPAAAQKGPGSYVSHFHLDHLGSTQATTTDTGALLEQMRYTAYGSVRLRVTGTGAPFTPASSQRYEFTGYETETHSGLQYAGARFYDPDLGSFLSHDPAAQFASPYTYTNWDPANLVDPSGAVVAITLGLLAKYAAVGFAVGFATAAIQAGVNGASIGQALQAGAIGGGIGAVAAGLLGPAGAAASNAGGSTWAAFQAFSLVSGGVGVAGAVKDGQYAVAAIGAIFLAYGVHSLAQGANSNVDKTSTGFEPGDATLDEFDLRAGDVLGTDEGTYARAVSLADPTGDIGHTQITLQDQNGNLRILTSDARGRTIVGPGDSAVSGRGYTVYRPGVQPSRGSFEGYAQAVSSSTRGALGGLSNYLGSAGGQVCSSTCNTALLAGVVPTGFAPNSFVTPNQLVGSNALLRVGRLPFIP